MKEEFIKLTNIAYKAIEFFPESDPLKNRTKDRALAIMENLTLLAGIDGWASLQKEKAKLQVSEDIDILLGYFWIAKCQGWLSSTNYLIISNEYKKIKKEVEPYIELTQKITFELPKVLETKAELPLEPALNDKDKNIPFFAERQSPPLSEISARQRKILEFLTNNEKAQVMDLQKILPDVTKRTIRRDLDELLETGNIVRMGEFNEVFYKISGERVYTG